MKKLIIAIRKTSEYKRWRNRILKEECSTYPKIPKFTQVHHTTNFSTLLNLYQITSVEEAISCKELWEVEGVVLTRGEHFLMTKFGFYKYVTKGFLILLDEKIKELKAAKRKIL